MAAAVEFRIRTEAGTWVLSRDGAELHRYSHVDRAVHEAVALARELDQTGQPAQVLVEAADGQVIEVSTAPEPGSAGPPQGEDRSALDPAR
jgi:hypothetical protein